MEGKVQEVEVWFGLVIDQRSLPLKHDLETTRLKDIEADDVCPASNRF